MKPFKITTAKSDQDIHGILTLQKQNLPKNITTEEAASQGFVTVDHDFDILKAMNQKFPHIIGKSNTKQGQNEVVAYALVMLREFSNQIPVLTPMFERIENLQFNGQNITPDQYFIMGQVCVDKPFRSLGVFAALYEFMQAQMKPHFDYIITEIADTNKRSIRAHEKVGFVTIETYQSKDTIWHIVLLDLSAE